MRKVNLLVGPLLWLACILLEPIGGTLSQRGVVGCVLWAAYYWATTPVKYGYTVFIPLIGAGSLPGIGMGEAVQALAHPNLMMLLAPALIVMTWKRWGVADRAALWMLSKTSGRPQFMAAGWVLLAATLSFVAANVVIAIALAPIMALMLQVTGSEVNVAGLEAEPDDYDMVMVSALAIGASLGGMMTPMAGGQAVITWGVLQEAVGEPVSFAAWTARLAPPTVLTVSCGALYFYYRGKNLYNQELREDAWPGTVRQRISSLRKQKGPVSREGWYSVGLLALGAGVLFSKPLWPSSDVLSPSLALTLLLVLALAIPAKGGSTRLLDGKAVKQFPFHGFAVWPVAMGLSELIGDTGAGQLVSPLLGDFWTQSALVGVGTVVILATAMSQIASDTGTAGILAPIIAGALVATSEPVTAWLLMMGFAANLSFLIPSATGTIAVPIILGGKNDYRLAKHGAFVVAGCVVIAFLFWWTVVEFDITFWRYI